MANKKTEIPKYLVQTLALQDFSYLIDPKGDCTFE